MFKCFTLKILVLILMLDILIMSHHMMKYEVERMPLKILCDNADKLQGRGGARMKLPAGAEVVPKPASWPA